MNLSRKLGQIKVWQQRLSTYMSMINFFMIFYLYIIESPMGLPWYLWAFVISSSIVIVVYVDTAYIMPHSFAYQFEKNLEWIEMKNEIKLLRKELKEIKELIKHDENNNTSRLT